MNIDQTLSAEKDVASFVTKLLISAYNSKASDIHIDPFPLHILVHMRIDGLLHDAIRYKERHINEIIGHIKILAGMRIDIHDKSQDGRFFFNINDRDVDVRVSIAPTYYGENAVLRILDRQHESFFDFKSLGFDDGQEAVIESAIFKSQGLILVAGPTGSGKTTTLYSILQKIRNSNTCIVTLEDPIEYSISGIRQIQIKPEREFTFFSALKNLLRQDPDVIMVGEIRDKETAHMAVVTALTGHLICSSIHASSAATVILRLIEMGVEPYLLAATLTLIVSQRLVRKINEKGEYAGRIGVFEVVKLSDELKALIIKKAGLSEIKQQLDRENVRTLQQDGAIKVEQGLTTKEELYRVLHD